MTLIITGIVYLDGCMPFIGTAIDETGMPLGVIFPDEQRVALLDTIEATGEMVTSPHHGGRPAFAIASVQDIKSAGSNEPDTNRATATVVSLSRSDRNTQGDAARNRK